MPSSMLVSLRRLLGPVLMTVGPWKPIKLEVYKSRITDVYIQPRVAEDLSATLDVTVSLADTPGAIASIYLKLPNGTLLIGGSNIKIKDSSSAHANFGLSKEAYERWYPVGYGDQPIYTVEVQITDEVCASVETDPERSLFMYSSNSKVRCWTRK